MRFGSGRVLKNSFTLVSAGAKDRKRLWVENVLPFFSVSGEEEAMERSMHR